MATEKLFYENVYCKTFQAKVLSCAAGKHGFDVVLDKTAFYPEGGGQAGDSGTLNGVRVRSTREREGAVIHLCEAPLEAGAEVTGVIDYDLRFARMQQHSGEHIVSGILNRRYGCHNTGFHMGADVITIDFDGVIPPQVLPEIEAEANGAVWQNLPVGCWYPSPEELPAIPYRSKKALAWPVRIVEIPGYDCCACCGTHVVRSGQVGLVKFLSVQKFRDGVRIELLSGKRAHRYLSECWAQDVRIAQALSVKSNASFAGVERVLAELSALKQRCAKLEESVFAQTAAQYEGKGDVLLFEDEMSGDSLRKLCDAVTNHCGGRCAVFAGTDGAYKYAIGHVGGDLRELTKKMNAELNGRGGGKPNFVQGSVAAARGAIEAFFAE